MIPSGLQNTPKWRETNSWDKLPSRIKEGTCYSGSKQHQSRSAGPRKKSADHGEVRDVAPVAASPPKLFLPTCLLDVVKHKWGSIGMYLAHSLAQIQCHHHHGYCYCLGIAKQCSSRRYSKPNISEPLGFLANFILTHVPFLKNWGKGEIFP